MSHPPYGTCRDIIRAEYGDSHNLLTPHVITFGGVLDKWAAEIAWGNGIGHGSIIVGVSVVLVIDEGTERCTELSRSFHGSDINALTDEALDYMKTLDGEVDDLLAHRRCLEVAERLGHEAGVAAGSWLLDGNSTERDAKRLLDGIEDGDPEILDQLPSAPLSGEWAGDPTPDDVIREVEGEVEVVVDDDSRDDILTAFELGFSEGVSDEATRSARAMLGEEA